MALIKCSECGHEVSNKASTCPNCGNPIKLKNGFNLKKPILSIVVLLLVLGCGFFAWNYSANNTDGIATADSLTIFNENGKLSKEQMNEEQELFECQTDQIREEDNKLKTQEVPEDYCSADDHCLYYAIDPHNKLSASKMIDYPMTFVYGDWDDYNSKGVAYQLQQYGVPQNECRESVRKLGYYSFSYYDDRVITWWEQNLFVFEGIHIRRMTLSNDYYSYMTYAEKIEKVHEAVYKFENELKEKGITFSDNRNSDIWKIPSRIAYYRDKIIVIEIFEYRGQLGAPDENITYGTIDIHILKKSVYDKRSESNIIYE